MSPAASSQKYWYAYSSRASTVPTNTQTSTTHRQSHRNERVTKAVRRSAVNRRNGPCLTPGTAPGRNGTSLRVPQAEYQAVASIDAAMNTAKGG